MWPGMPPHSSMFHTSFHTSPKSIRIRVSNCDKLRTERKHWIPFKRLQVLTMPPPAPPALAMYPTLCSFCLQWWKDGLTMVYRCLQFTAKLWGVCSNPCRSILMRLAFFATFGLIRFNWRAGHVHSLWHLTHHFRCMPAPSLFSGSAQMLVEQVERRQCFIRSPFAEWQADGFDIAKHRDKDVHLFLN